MQIHAEYYSCNLINRFRQAEYSKSGLAMRVNLMLSISLLNFTPNGNWNDSSCHNHNGNNLARANPQCPSQ